MIAAQLVVLLAGLLKNQKRSLQPVVLVTSQLPVVQPAVQETRSDHKVSGPLGPEALKRGSVE